MKQWIFIFTGLVLLLFNYACSKATAYNMNSGTTTMKTTAPYENGKFNNRKKWKQPSFGENVAIAWDFFFKGDERVPDIDLPLTTVDLTHFNRSGEDQLNVTWLGHSSLMINIDGYKILTDPVFETKVSVFGPTRFNGNLPMDINQMETVDVVIVSHNHYDHLNKFTIRFLKDKTKVFVVPIGVGDQLESWGVNRNIIVEMNWWEEHNVNTDLMIAATPSQHFSGRGITDRNKTLWASWVIKSSNHSVFFSGDSGYFDGFKKIGDTYGPFDMTFLECGAYDEKWYPVHMYPEETVQAHLDLKGNILHPIHWATFNLGLHAWYEPMERFAAAADAASVTSATPVVGGTTVFNTDIVSSRWWEPLVAKHPN